jgi:hypothetical protein
MELRLAHLWIALAALVSAAAVFAGGYRAGMANAAMPPEAASSQTFPDWFLPIWDAYDRNPAVTPNFDFSSLYSGDIGADG